MAQAAPSRARLPTRTRNPLTVTAPTGTSSYAYDAPTHAFTYTATPPTPSSGVSLPSSARTTRTQPCPWTAVDPNSQTVTYKSYDPLLRPTEIDYPDGGKMIASYTANQTGVYHYMTASTHTNTQTNFDSYGPVQLGRGAKRVWGATTGTTTATMATGTFSNSSYRFTSGTIACSGGGDTYTYERCGACPDHHPC